MTIDGNVVTEIELRDVIGRALIEGGQLSAPAAVQASDVTVALFKWFGVEENDADQD
jgi:hypothetical protein